MMENSSNLWSLLNNNVIDSGLCTHCGTCVGLNSNILEFKESEFGPLPFQKANGALCAQP